MREVVEMLHLVITDCVASLALLVLVCVFIICALVRALTNKGPMLWPILGIIPTALFHVDDIYDWLTETLNRCDGKFAFRGLWMSGVHGVVTSDPLDVECILKTRFHNYPKGKFYTERFYDLLGDGIFNTDGEKWKERRQVAIRAMNSSRFLSHALQTTEDLLQKKMLPLLGHFASTGEAVDLQQVLLRLTFDMTCRTGFDADPGYLDLNLPDAPVAKAFEDANLVIQNRFLVPPLIWKLMKFFSVGSEKMLKDTVGVAHEFAEKIAADRMNEYKKLGGLKARGDILSRLIEIKCSGEEGMEEKFSAKYLQDFMASFVVAGRDTTSASLSWFFWLIHKHPVVENRILSEINEMIKDRESEEECLYSTEFTVDELERMVYLQAALSESLRLYPAIPVNLKEVQHDDVLPDGTPITKGSQMIFCVYATARAEEIWGKDCREFKPERWIKDGKFVRENEFKYAVFNAGPRLCLGKKLAYMQMKMVVASILSKYSIKVVEGHPVVPKLTISLYMKHGLLTTVRHRSIPKP
ncbi:hypothetical protein Sjap_016325 [Stephania japonica]|uniref:Cytochrome P450 n=1 Tax=Stephania japonica TaxID=461633 RepID=A0AAP0IM03_9MAGN